MEHLKTLTVQIEHQIATITLNRPNKKNAISFQMMDELIEVAHKLKRNREVRAVIVMGADGNFSSGLDLADLNHPKNLGVALYELAKPTPSKFQKVCLIWQSLPVPVIAVVQGVCVGGGLHWHLGRIFVLQRWTLAYQCLRLSGVWLLIWALRIPLVIFAEM